MTMLRITNSKKLKEHKKAEFGSELPNSAKYYKSRLEGQIIEFFYTKSSIYEVINI